jgi:hypothetical protein
MVSREDFFAPMKPGVTGACYEREIVVVVVCAITVDVMNILGLQPASEPFFHHDNMNTAILVWADRVLEVAGGLE